MERKRNLEWYKRSSCDEDKMRNQTINQNKIARGNKKKRLPYWKHMLIDQKRKNKANCKLIDNQYFHTFC